MCGRDFTLQGKKGGEEHGAAVTGADLEGRRYRVHYVRGSRVIIE